MEYNKILDQILEGRAFILDDGDPETCMYRFHRASGQFVNIGEGLNLNVFKLLQDLRLGNLSIIKQRSKKYKVAYVNPGGDYEISSSYYESLEDFYAYLGFHPNAALILSSGIENEDLRYS